VRKILCLAAFSFLLVARTGAQSPNGTISGLVVDPSGAAIVGADILLANDATGVQYSTETNAAGIYLVSDIPPGTYRLQVSKIGFKTLIKPAIVLNVQDALAINFTLPLGAVSETVTVQGGAPLVNTTTGSVSTVIGRNFVESLPLNGRSFNTLLQLTPGVVIAPSTFGSPGQYSIAGQRTDANNFTVDGVSANFGVGLGQNLGQSGTGGAQAFSALGGTSSLASVDDLQEFRIETSSFAPEFGRAPGGQVILTTRSGTNSFHGEIFDYFRNTVMDANDWFANSAGNLRAPEHHNDFGGTLGGPIWKDKTFFFFSYEGARLDLPQTTTIQVPSAYARQVAPAAVAPYLDAYPQPNDKTVTAGVYTAPFTGTYANRANLNAVSLRIDHTFSHRFSIFGRYNYAPSQISGPQSSLSTFQTTPVNTQTLTAGVNVVLNPRISNTFRGNYSAQSAGQSFSLDSFGGAVPLDSSLLLGSLPENQNLAIFYSADTQDLYLGHGGTSTTHQGEYVDDLAASVGAHQLKFGGDFRAIYLNVNSAQNYFLYELFGTQNFISTSSISALASFTFLPVQFLSRAFSLYGQDTWRVMPRLSLTYGLRWELDPAPSGRGKTELAAWQNTNNPGMISLAPAGSPLWRSTYGNFAPRFGVAYSLTPRGDFVLRAGAGIFYDPGVGATSNLAFTFPDNAVQSFQNVPVPITDVTPYLTTISVQPPYPGYLQGFSSTLKLPRSYQWNIAVEKSFRGQQAISVTYVGQAGRDLLRQEALPQPDANFAQGSVLRLTVNDARSNYNALQLQYRRPIGSRFRGLFNYTWAHSLDNASEDLTVGLSNTVISGVNDYASSGFDVRQSFAGALTYNVPAVGKSGALARLTGDWSLSTVVIARTGFPFNANISAPSNFGVLYIRPDRVPGQPVWISSRNAPGGKILNYDAATNTGAFSIPSAQRQGTEARNDIPGFGLTQIDFSVTRKFPITERLGLQFRADAFNVFNHPNFTNPGGYLQYGPYYLQSEEMLNQGLGGLNPLFQQGGPRSLQLSLKMMF
jgi:Carboxypeptidase regulatory-like domain/TonB-dependent Receptor Plug Domain